MLVVTSTYFYTVIFMFHLPYMDVYFEELRGWCRDKSPKFLETTVTPEDTLGGGPVHGQTLGKPAESSPFTNLKNYPHIYTNKRLIFYMYMWIIFEIVD